MTGPSWTEPPGFSNPPTCAFPAPHLPRTTNARPEPCAKIKTAPESAGNTPRRPDHGHATGGHAMAEITLTPLPGTDENLFKRFMKHVQITEGCWPWKGCTLRGGYGRFDTEGRHLRAHRVAYLTFRGPIPGGTLVCHSCDNPPCVNPAHLWLGTNHENILDALAKGRHKNRVNLPRPEQQNLAIGERNGSAVLTQGQVVELRLMAAGGMQFKLLAKEFGVCPSTIADIVHRRKWKHV